MNRQDAEPGRDHSRGRTQQEQRDEAGPGHQRCMKGVTALAIEPIQPLGAVVRGVQSPEPADAVAGTMHPIQAEVRPRGDE